MDTQLIKSRAKAREEPLTLVVGGDSEEVKWPSAVTLEGQQSPRFIYIRAPPKVLPEPTPTKTIFLNSHNLNANANQNHTDTGTHRSRKEKLICRSIVTSEPAPSAAMEVSPPDPTPLTRHYARPYIGVAGGSQVKDKDGQPFSRLPTVTQLVKTKCPRKSKLIPVVEEGERNGNCDSSPPSPVCTAKVPKRMRMDSGGTNGVVPPPKSPTKPRKEKLPRPPSSSDKPKRKYTKRKVLDQTQQVGLDDQFQNSRLFPGSGPSGPSEPFGDSQWHHPFPPAPELPHFEGPPSSLRSPRLSPGRPNRLVDESCEMRETRVPNNNTHLLLSPQTLKRMLRSPSPASQNANVALSDDELDEEIMQASNSLFKDMSLRRGEEAGSPTRSSYASSSSTTSSSPQGRGRYSRRKFGRLYPSFDPNHCLHPHCLEATLTGSKYCASHAKPHLPQPSSSLFAQCIYTDPFSLKPCKKTVYGEDEREFKFCEVHSERVTGTRLRMQRSEGVKVKDETMDSLMEDLEKCLVEDDTPPPPPSSPIPTTDEGHDTPTSPVSPGGEVKEREELKDFLCDLDRRLWDQSGNLQLYSRFQPDQDSDEDIAESGQDDPLKHAGYYSTDEVIWIYRSRLDKLRSLYQSQFNGLKEAYMESRQRCGQETERNEGRKFSFTSDPKFIGLRNSKLTDKYKEEELEARERSLALIKYRHRFGPRKVVQFQAKKQRERQKTVVSVREMEGDVESPFDLNEALKAERIGAGSRSDGDRTLQSPTKTCVFAPDSDASPCPHLPLPLSNYCKKHILQDSEQLLFGECGRLLGDSTDVCTNPIVKGLEKGGCLLHSLAEVSDPRASDEELHDINTHSLAFPFAELEEEQDVLEELVAKETFSMSHFDRAVQYLDAKGFEPPDTDESEGGEDEEEDEAFKNLLLEELRIQDPRVLSGAPPRRANGKRKKEKAEEESFDSPAHATPPRPPLQSQETSMDVGEASIALRYLPLLPAKEEESEALPTLVLLSTD